jgi:hypothetical protein
MLSQVFDSSTHAFGIWSMLYLWECTSESSSSVDGTLDADTTTELFPLLFLPAFAFAAADLQG